MSFQPQSIDPLPEETVRLARAASPKGHRSVPLREACGPISKNEDVVNGSPRRGHPAEAPWRRAFCLVLPFREGVSDRQAAAAVRGRREWKELLGWERDDPGVDACVLVACRQRLLASKEACLRCDLWLPK